MAQTVQYLIHHEEMKLENIIKPAAVRSRDDGNALYQSSREQRGEIVQNTSWLHTELVRRVKARGTGGRGEAWRASPTQYEVSRATSLWVWWAGLCGDMSRRERQGRFCIV